MQLSFNVLFPKNSFAASCESDHTLTVALGVTNEMYIYYGLALFAAVVWGQISRVP